MHNSKKPPNSGIANSVLKEMHLQPQPFQFFMLDGEDGLGKGDSVPCSIGEDKYNEKFKSLPSQQGKFSLGTITKPCLFLGLSVTRGPPHID